MPIDLPPKVPPAIIEFMQYNNLDINNLHHYCNWNGYEVYFYFNTTNNGKAIGLLPYILHNNNVIKIITSKFEEYDRIHAHCNNVNRGAKPR